MDNELEKIVAQKKELQGYSDELLAARRKLKEYKANIEGSWSGKEAEIIVDAVDKLNLRLYRMSEEIEQLGVDILKVYTDNKSQE